MPSPLTQLSYIDLIRDFGGRPSASDCSPVLQRAVDAVCNEAKYSGRSIYIPSSLGGQWNFESPILIRAAGVKFIGAGLDFWDPQNGTVLQYSGTLARSLTDVVTTNGNPTIGSASNPFVTAHAGCTILLTGLNVGGAGINTLSVGIQSVVDSQHVILKTSPQASLTGVIAQVQDDFFRIGSDDGHAWDAAEYNGFSNTEFRHLAITGVGNTTGANTLPNLYAKGTYGIRDWRGGSVIMERCWVSHFEQGFTGINSDFNKFDWVQFNYNHVGAYYGPRSDQSTHNNCQYANNDTGLMIRGASRFTDVGGTYVNSGSATTYGIDIGNEAQFTNVNAWAIHFLNPWFEINTNPASFPAFMRISAATDNQVLGVVIDNPFCTGPTYPATPSCQYFAEIGNASKIAIRDAMLQPQFQHLLHFTAETDVRPQVVTITTAQYAPTVFPIPQTDYVADVGSSPAVSILIADGSGWEFNSPVNYNNTTFTVNSSSADQLCQPITFNTKGQSGNSVGAVLTNKILGYVIANGNDGTIEALGGNIRIVAKEPWSTGHHGTGFVFTGTLNGQTGQTDLLLLNFDGTGSTQLLPGNQVFGSTGFGQFFNTVTLGQSGGSVNPNYRVSDGTIVGKLQCISGSTALVGTETAHNFGIYTNNALAVTVGTDGSVAPVGTFNSHSYTVATLPTPGTAGRIAYASNGRKTAEGAGVGTGVLCYDDAVAWRRVDDSTTVAA